MGKVIACVNCRYCRMRWSVKVAGATVAGAVAVVAGVIHLPL